MIASYKFIQKLWILHNKIKSILNSEATTDEKTNKTEELNKFTNQMIEKISHNIEKFNYNVIVANLYEIYNFYIKQTNFYIDKKIVKKNYINILHLIFPIIPHFAQECLNEMNFTEEAKWPIAEEKYLVEEEKEIVVQFNGKKRITVKSKTDSIEKEVYNQIIETEYFKNNYKIENIKKIIFVKNRLMNLIIK